MRWYENTIRLRVLASVGNFIGITGTRAIVMNYYGMISSGSGMAGVGSVHNSKAMADGAVNICDCGLASAAAVIGVIGVNFGAMRASSGAADFPPEISGHPTTVWLPTSRIRKHLRIPRLMGHINDDSGEKSLL